MSIKEAQYDHRWLHHLFAVQKLAPIDTDNNDGKHLLAYLLSGCCPFPLRTTVPSMTHQSRSRSCSCSRGPGQHGHALADSIASLPARATVAQAGVEALIKGTPLGVDLLYRWDTHNEGATPQHFGDAEYEASDVQHNGTERTTPGTSSGEHGEEFNPQNQDDIPIDEEGHHLAWCKDLPWWKRPSVSMLYPLIFLLSCATGLIIPVLVEFMDQLACEQMYFAPQPATPGLPIVSPTSLATMGIVSWLGGSYSNTAAPKLPYGPDDPTLCHTPAVLAASASLQMRYTVVGGLLSVLMTG